MTITHDFETEVRQAKPIFVIWSSIPCPMEIREDVRNRMPDYYVMFMCGEPKCQLFTIQQSIDFKDLQEFESYIKQ